jgi:hypothetical protein
MVSHLLDSPRPAHVERSTRKRKKRGQNAVGNMVMAMIVRRDLYNVNFISFTTMDWSHLKTYIVGFNLKFFIKLYT